MKSRLEQLKSIESPSMYSILYNPGSSPLRVGLGFHPYKLLAS